MSASHRGSPPGPFAASSPAPEPAKPVRPDVRLWAGVLGFWTAMGLLESAKAMVMTRLRGVPETWSHALVGNMPWWWLWAALTPLIFWLVRRFPLHRAAGGGEAHGSGAGRGADARGGGADARATAGTSRSGLALPIVVHSVASLVLSLAHLAVAGSLYYLTHTRGVYFDSVWIQIRNMVGGYVAVDVLTYWAVVGAFYALEFYRRFREQELSAARLQTRTAQLEASMSEARLNALRMELNPHFLFNTLNAISGLVRRRENEAAIHTLATLGDLLRVTLERGRPREVPLADELEFLGRYLEIEQVRFRDRLSIDIDVPDPLLDALVPPLILQPLVENAVRHGIARTPGPGRVTVRAREDGETLRLEVRDSGPGFADEPRPTGVGLSNTRDRLGQLYGEMGELRLENAVEGGAVVLVALPLRFAAELVPGEASMGVGEEVVSR